MLYYIWSIEHDAWWRPGERGYTRKLSEAGVYTEERSMAIVIAANIRHFHECRIPTECLLLTDIDV